MTITVNQKKISTFIKNTERVIAKGNTLPILQTILLKAEKGLLKISATNLELGLTYFLNAKISKEGAIAVPAKVFSDFIGNITDEKVDLNNKGNILNIDANKYKTQILCFDTNEFPTLPMNKEKNGFKLRAQDLKNSLMSVIDSTSLSESRPELSGVYINFGAQRIEFAATDSYRLSEKIMEVKDGIAKSLILPRSTVLELIRVLSDETDDVSVSFSDNQIFVYNDTFELVSRLIEGHYPEYKRVIPDKFISLARIKKDEFEKGIRTSSIFSSNIADVKIKIFENRAEIHAKNSDKGEINAVLACELKNEPFEVTANYNYILDGLKSIETDKVLVQFTGEGSPLVIRPDNEKNFTYLIMPLRS